MKPETCHIGNKSDYLEYRRGSGGTIEIFDLAVHSVRQQGVGTRLVYELLREVPDAPFVFAITRAGNWVAQRFYESVNFRVVGYLHNFYKIADGLYEDAVMYGRKPGSDE